MLFFLCLAILITGCSNDEPKSAFDEILNQPPYTSITDSIRKQPESDELYFRRAVLLDKNNLPDPALADFRKAWSLEQKEEYAIGISNILLEKKPDSAIVFLNDALKELPKSIFLQLNLAGAYDAVGKTNEALTTCDAILQQKPNDVNTLLLKSDLLLKKNDTAGVVASLEKAYAVMPSNREISNKLAYQYAETKNSKAIPLADSLIAKDSLKIFPDPFYIKGLFYSNTGDKTKAIQSFDQAIKTDHRYLNAYIEKGKILFDQKKTNEALKTFQLANTITPSFPDAWYWIGRCQEVLGDKAEAKQSYEKAYELDNTFLEAKEVAEKIK